MIESIKIIQWTFKYTLFTSMQEKKLCNPFLEILGIMIVNN
jgi:hypothetical protein